MGLQGCDFRGRGREKRSVSFPGGCVRERESKGEGKSWGERWVLRLRTATEEGGKGQRWEREVRKLGAGQQREGAEGSSKLACVRRPPIVLVAAPRSSSWQRARLGEVGWQGGPPSCHCGSRWENHQAAGDECGTRITCWPKLRSGPRSFIGNRHEMTMAGWLSLREAKSSDLPTSLSLQDAARSSLALKRDPKKENRA
ncbi:uncharacterized protein BCR38DRAFT_115241 [Pseudomassariella vexata]|uniref:Uncharacterized protein n=1 Tax=Pseudomassariella vexata TaxID=1141098 RepID=A0A1Y2DBQ3_9PEZI|nr:uncharacterized protein BCR38DRAFT_115241 [Pseudomassariella vexata]ORY56627.1 hypothetical protein BCR38DRAFT_115241 [Pseudomassariella vexata]